MKEILNEMMYQLKENLLDKWYPKIIDTKNGGYYSNLTYNFELTDKQDKMIVTQARHIWTLAKAATFFNNSEYLNYANHGIGFLTEKLWDADNNGFFQIKSEEGNYTETEGWRNEKRTYGNAFALYGIAALYKTTKNQEVLDFAENIFNWIEDYAHDSINKGYFQFFTQNNKLFDTNSNYKSVANDANEVGYKDQNSSIHLLEAFTEAYSILKTPLLKVRLEELLILIRDTITSDKGNLRLFFTENWEPISFKASPIDVIEANYGLDHVSFGHDYETAFLMLEASHTLGSEDDVKTLSTAKKMVDHALENGWDEINGGFFEEGYYFSDEDKCTIIKNTKNWWAQAEALNIFLIMSKIFPDEKKYLDTFLKEWEYIKKNIIDKEHGGWFCGGTDIEPEKVNALKGEIWKGTYHNGRALMNCIAILSSGNNNFLDNHPGIKDKSEEMNCLIEHWKTIATSL